MSTFIEFLNLGLKLEKYKICCNDICMICWASNNILIFMLACYVRRHLFSKQIHTLGFAFLDLKKFQNCPELTAHNWLERMRNNIKSKKIREETSTYFGRRACWKIVSMETSSNVSKTLTRKNVILLINFWKKPKVSWSRQNEEYVRKLVNSPATCIPNMSLV